MTEYNCDGTPKKRYQASTTTVRAFLQKCAPHAGFTPEKVEEMTLGYAVNKALYIPSAIRIPDINFPKPV